MHVFWLRLSDHFHEPYVVWTAVSISFVGMVTAFYCWLRPAPGELRSFLSVYLAIACGLFFLRAYLDCDGCQYVLFSNDGPYGSMVAEFSEMSARDCPRISALVFNIFVYVITCGYFVCSEPYEVDTPTPVIS